MSFDNYRIQFQSFEPLDVSFDLNTDFTTCLNNSEISQQISHKLCDLDVSFSSDNTLLTIEPVALRARAESMSKTNAVNVDTQRLVAHYLKFNQSYNGLEEMAHIVNVMHNVSIKVPESRYKIMKEINPRFKIEFHIFCVKCKNYTATPTNEVLCCVCCNKLKTATSNYFVYIPVKQQLEKVIEENWDEIMAYRSQNGEANTMTDIHDSIQFKRAKKKYEPNFKVLSLAAGTDGAAVASKSLWAIHLYQNFLKPSMRYVPKNILCVAFFCQSSKPNMHSFFHPLLNELKNIESNGGLVIKKGNQIFKFMPIITQFIADLPARVDVQGWTSYNGYKACTYCEHPGVSITSIKNNKTTKVVRYIHREEVDELRDHVKLLQIYKQLKRSKQPIDGVKEVSCMIAAAEFDLIHGFGIDYMHCALLGVTKKLMELWLDSTNHSEKFYIKPRDQDILSKRIVSIKPICEITRKPGPVKGLANYKANEFRSLLLYFLRYCLVGLLSHTYIEHFQLFSFAIYTLLKDNISFDEINLAEKNLVEFVDKFDSLYGHKNVTMNLHLLKHIANCVRNVGPLWVQSAFALEANNGIITKTTAKKSILHSVSFKYNARNSLSLSEEKKTPIVSLKGKQNIRLNTNELNTLRNDGFHIGKSGLMNIYERIEMKKTKFTSKKCKEVSTIDFFVKMKNGQIGAVAFYFTANYNVNAYVELYEVEKVNDQYFIVNSTGTAGIFNIKEISNKLIYIKIGVREVVTERPNSYEKT